MIKIGDKVTVTGNRGLEQRFPLSHVCVVEDAFNHFRCEGNPQGYDYVVVRGVDGKLSTLRAERCSLVEV